MSLAQIGRLESRHESTIAYWAARHGLVPAHRERHVARGPLSRELLAELVESGASIAEIATAVGRSKTTVRHWLRRFELKTSNAVGRPRAEASRLARQTGAQVVEMDCPRHGRTPHVIDGRTYYRCRRCRAEAVSRRRRKVKALLVAEAGGCCRMCGYGANVQALQFHHRDPSTKLFALNARGVSLSLDVLRAEASKCDLLCANCHAEVEAERRTRGRSHVPCVE
jgi:transposase